MFAGAMSYDHRTQDAGLRVFNVAKPTAPHLVAFAQCDTKENDFAIVGNILAEAVDGLDKSQNPYCKGKGLPADYKYNAIGVRIWDIRDPSNPKPINFVPIRDGVHTLRAVPGTSLIYLGTAFPFKFIDISNPLNPTVTDDATPKGTSAVGCHEIGFDAVRKLAFCAGIQPVTEIWDIEDPRQPKVIGVIRNPLISHHHNAEVSRDGRTLIIADEYLPSIAVGPVGCPGTVDGSSPPTGALWFYDIAGDKVRKPILLGWWSPPELFRDARMCSAHNFDLFPDRDWLAAAWYEDGLFVLDFSDVRNTDESRGKRVQMVARHRTNGVEFWDAKVHRGFLYANSVSPMLIGSELVTGYPPPPGSGTNARLLGGGGLYIFWLDGFSPPR